MAARDRRPSHARRSRRPARIAQHGELVLVASDDFDVRRALCDRLYEHGYRAILASAGASATTPVDQLAAQVQPAVILLDLDGSDDHGLFALTRIRELPRTPVIALSARAAEGDKVAALDAGADDYITKPFGTQELFARLRVALRYARSQPRFAEEAAMEVGPIRIDPARRAVSIAGKPVHLTPLEFRLLTLLARSRGAVVRREQLLREIWGAEAAHREHLRVQIAALRKKLEVEPGKPCRLITIAGVGYRLRTDPG